MFNFFSISIRWQVIIILFLATMISFILRINLSIVSLKMSEEYLWNNKQLSLLFSSFYIGYSIGQIPSILFAEKYGGSIILGTSIAISSFLNALIPLISKRSFIGLLVIQILNGLFQAAAFPSCYYLYPRWMPINERTIMVGFVISGVFLVRYFFL